MQKKNDFTYHSKYSSSTKNSKFYASAIFSFEKKTTYNRFYLTIHPVVVDLKNVNEY